MNSQNPPNEAGELLEAAAGFGTMFGQWGGQGSPGSSAPRALVGFSSPPAWAAAPAGFQGLKSVLYSHGKKIHLLMQGAMGERLCW